MTASMDPDNGIVSSSKTMNTPLNNSPHNPYPRKKLSLCMTTRNRAKLLGQTLDSILSQVTEEVEIIIIDGASTDETEEVVRGYQEKFPSLHYHRKDINSGVDRDYNASIEAAQGEYCWFMSDDDLIKPGALRTVLDATEKGYSAIIVNAEDWNADFTVRVGKNRLPFTTDRVYHPQEFEQFFIDTAHHLSFIPGLVIRRDIWLSRERERYFGSWFAHVGVVFQCPLPDDAFVIADPLIAIRNGNISWGSKIFEIWLIRWPDLIWSLTNFPDSIKSKICSRNLSQNWKSLFAYRSLGNYSINDYNNFILTKTKNGMSRIIPFIISKIPIRLANILSFFYSIIVAPRSRVPFFNIINSKYFIFSTLVKYFNRRR